MKVAARPEIALPTRERRDRKADVDADDDAHGFGRFLRESRVKAHGARNDDGDDDEADAHAGVQAMVLAQAVALLDALPSRSRLTSSIPELREHRSDAAAAAGEHLQRVAHAPRPEREDDGADKRGDRDGSVVSTFDAPVPPGHFEAPIDVAFVAAPSPVEASEQIARALDALNDPAAFANLDRSSAVVVVDGLHIRLSTRDGAASVSVEGRQSQAVLSRSPELREAMGQAGLALQRLTAAGANTDAHLDRHGRAVVDVDEDAAPRAVADDDVPFSVNA